MMLFFNFLPVLTLNFFFSPSSFWKAEEAARGCVEVCHCARRPAAFPAERRRAVSGQSTVSHPLQGSGLWVLSGCMRSGSFWKAGHCSGCSGPAVLDSACSQSATSISSCLMFCCPWGTLQGRSQASSRAAGPRTRGRTLESRASRPDPPEHSDPTPDDPSQGGCSPPCSY